MALLLEQRRRHGRINAPRHTNKYFFSHISTILSKREMPPPQNHGGGISIPIILAELLV
jgi:hypothetical protein